jgi:hypothetical protein
MKHIPVHHLEGVGWVAEPDFWLNPFQMQAVVRFTYKVNHDRWLSMKPGDQKDKVWKALQELQTKGVTQMPPKSEDGSRDLFKSTARMHPERVFSIPG